MYISSLLPEIDNDTEEQKGNQEPKEPTDEKTVPNSSHIPLPSGVIDHEIEVQLSEWNKNADMLFSIHPMDGSLLVWHVDWLDEYQPGMFRQVQVTVVFLNEILTVFHAVQFHFNASLPLFLSLLLLKYMF